MLDVDLLTREAIDFIDFSDFVLPNRELIDAAIMSTMLTSDVMRVGFLKECNCKVDLHAGHVSWTLGRSFRIFMDQVNTLNRERT